jgi:hypothetical protein
VILWTITAFVRNQPKVSTFHNLLATASINVRGRLTEYVKANDALVQQTATVMSVEATIAQRRLQEEYCLRFVRCSLDDQNSAIFGVQFDSCLKDEALEKYDAVPADTD